MKPVIYVPGYPASHLHDRASGEKIFATLGLVGNSDEILRRLELDAADDLAQADPIVAGEPIRTLARFLFFDIAKQAGSLYDILDRLGAPTVRFGWDWRRPIWDPGTQARLARAIEDQHRASNRPVVLVVHSTGGLVLRRLLEAHAGDHGFLGKIEHIVAFGVPWAGTLKSFQYLLGRRDFWPLSRAQVQRLVALTWAGFDLLPPDPNRTDLRDHTGRPLGLVVDRAGHQVSVLDQARRGWFEPGLAARMARRADASDAELGARPSTLALGGVDLPVTNVVGFGADTAVSAVLEVDGRVDRLVVSKEDTTLDGGDETVPRASAAWLRGPNVSTYHVPVGMDHLLRVSPHSVLWRNPGGQNLLRHILTDTPLEPFVYAAVDGDDYWSGPQVRVRLVALDQRGAPLAGAAARAVGLVGGDSPWSLFDPAREGRHQIVVGRGRIPRVPTAARTFRRLTVEIRWVEGGVEQVQGRRLVVGE